MKSTKNGGVTKNAESYQKNHIHPEGLVYKTEGETELLSLLLRTECDI